MIVTSGKIEFAYRCIDEDINMYVDHCSRFGSRYQDFLLDWIEGQMIAFRRLGLMSTEQIDNVRNCLRAFSDNYKDGVIHE